MPVSFRPLQRADFALLAKWLALPHVAPWWSDEPTVAALEASYGPVVDGDDPTEAFIVELEGRPVGFIQRYLLDDYPAWCDALGIERAAGIDYLIGVAELTGVGLGPVIVDVLHGPDLRALRATSTGWRWRSSRRTTARGVRSRRPATTGCSQGMIESDDPSDSGPSYVYVRSR